jgi:hypothetical protein
MTGQGSMMSHPDREPEADGFDDARVMCVLLREHDWDVDWDAAEPQWTCRRCGEGGGIIERG